MDKPKRMIPLLYFIPAAYRIPGLPGTSVQNVAIPVFRILARISHKTSTAAVGNNVDVVVRPVSLDT